jgi:hypothetical protein
LINLWSNKWLVDFNPNKTEAIVFTQQPNVKKAKLQFDGIPVEFVESHKH